MNELLIKERIWDRSYSTGELILNGKTIQCTNISPLLKTTRPDEVDLLYMTKTRHLLEHVQSFIVRLFDSPKIYFPKIDNAHNSIEHFMDGSKKNPFENYLDQMVSFPDVGLEYLIYDKNRNKIRDFANSHKDLKPLFDYINLLDTQKKNMKDAPKKFVNYNKSAHDNFWRELFSNNESRRREAMIGKIHDYQRKYYDYDNPPTNFVDSHEMFGYAKKINETSQAMAYSNKRECATSFTLSSRILLDDDLFGKILEYIKNDKNKLTILKFKGLDLRAKVDYTMRNNFKFLLKTISDIKFDNKNKAFMMLEAGNQYVVCLPVFDIVSRSFAMIDNDISYGRNNGRGQFWDTNKNYPRRATEMEQVFDNNPEEFRRTNEVGHEIADLKTIPNKEFNKIRRQYFLACLNKQAMEMKTNTLAGTSEVYLNQILRNSELSPLKDLIIN